MCGIAGKFNLRGEAVSGDLIRRMCDKIRYRGPDDSGVYQDGNIGLGHLRLSIIDLSELGHQPMASHDGKIWITFNGEIYNFQQVRKTLLQKGYPFKSNCDTEVIIYLYKEYGERCVEYLRGMFAFGIWDVEHQKLFLSRDRIGQKPLYYYFDGRKFIFASEIKAILADPSVPKEINYEALADYFKYLYVPDPKSIYKNIWKLEPGHCMTVSIDGLKKSQYWDVSFQHPVQRDQDELSARLLELLNESVKLRMMSDVPLGAFLSGGIDSSAIVAFMAANQNGKPLTTCTIGFDSNEFDEMHYARQVADKFETDHREFTVKQKAEQVLPNLAYHFDEPFADSSAVPTYYVSKLARQAVKVALAGDGGDENFAGYEKYHLDDIENRWRQRFPGRLRKGFFPHLARLFEHGNHTLFRRGKTLLNSLSQNPDYGFYLTNTEMPDAIWQDLLNEDTRKAIGSYDPFTVTEKYYHATDTDDHLSKILYVDLKTYLPGDILVKVDRMSMANSLEVRAPILDHNIIQFAAHIPGNLKYKNGEKKHILKLALAPLLPDEILYRRKMGFSVPLAEWFRGELQEFAKAHLLCNESALHLFFKMDVIEHVWQRHQSCTADHSVILWSLLMFELWYRKFMN